jgi:serine/threonine-protein kinase
MLPSVGGEKRPARIVGRYAIYDAIASGGMATVHLGRLLGPVGFSRTVAIKRLHAQYASDPEFVSMFLDEARLAARIRHPHVVPTLDVVATEGELFLVMDYVPGESLSRVMRTLAAAGATVPPRIASAIISGVLHGLHAAHEAKNERGEPLGIVHRDVSPQNILVGSDGQARVFDFGVAKAAGRVQTTREGQLKGKLSYMSPEQLGSQPLDRRCDVYAASVVLWEMLTGERLFAADNEGAVIARVLEGEIKPPGQVLRLSGRVSPELTPATLARLDEITLRGLRFKSEERYATAREMALALEDCLPPATAARVASWVERHASSVLDQRAVQVAEIESNSSSEFVAYPAGAVSPSSPNASEAPQVEIVTIAGPVNPSNLLGEPGSQVSGVSTTRAPHTHRRSRTPLAITIALLLGLGVMGVLIARSMTRKASPTPPVVAASAPASVFLLEPPGSSPIAAPARSTPSAPSASAAPTPAPPITRRPARPRAGKPPAKPSCDPPYTLDADGHKHYKPECL